MNDSKQRKTGAILSYVSIIVNTLIQLLYTPLLIRMLGQSEYGLYSLANSIIGYLTVLDLGFGNAIIVYTAKYRAKKDKESEQKLHGMFKIVFYVIGIIAVILGLILYLNVNLFFKQTMTDVELNKARIMMLILTFNLGITFSFSIYSSIISAYEKFTFQKIIAISSTIMKPLIMIPLLFLGMKSITMTLVITFANVFVVTSNYLFCKKKLKVNIKFNGFDKALFKTILGYSIWIFIGVIVDKVNWSVDNFILGSVSGTVAVSIYSLATTLNQLFINLSNAASSVLLPKMSKMIAKNASPDKITKEFVKIGRLQHLIIFLMVSGFIIIGKEFFQIWAGEGYEDSYYTGLLLIIPVCVPLIQNLGISIRQAMNKHRFSSIVRMCVAILNLIISIPLAKAYGAIGAAAGTCIGLTISTIIQNFYYHLAIKLDIIYFWKTIIKMSIPFIIPWVITITFKNFIVLDGILSLILYGGIFTATYCFTAYFLSMNEYEKNIIKKPIIIRRKK